VISLAILSKEILATGPFNDHRRFNMKLRVPEFVLVTALLLTGCSTSSGPDETSPPEPFSVTFGGEGWDLGYDVAQTSDGAYLCIGDAEFSGAGDLWVLKSDDKGNEVWSRTYGGSQYDWGASIQPIDGGAIIACGSTQSFGHGNNDAWLLNMDAQGDTLWSRTFGGSEHESANAVLQVQGGGFALAGYTTSFGAGGYDAWLLKTDAEGNELWNRTYGGSENEIASDVAETEDGGFVVTGYTESSGAGDDDLWLIRTDSEGNEVWSQTYGGIGQDRGSSVRQTDDGGFIAVGFTKSYGAGDSDLWLIKTDAQGNETWSRIYGGTASDYGTSVRKTENSGFVILGCTKSFGAGLNDIWLIHVDAQGDSLWSRTFGGTQNDQGNNLHVTNDGGFICVGSTESYGAGSSDLWLIKTDENGSTETSR